MIPKTKSLTKMPPSTGDKEVFPRIAPPPSPLEEYEKRKRLYANSGVFINELSAVVGDLLRVSADHRNHIFRFLKWFHPESRKPQAIAARIRSYPNATRAALEHYVAFAFRFRVWIRTSKTKSGEITFSPVYDEISDRNLHAELRNGTILPPGGDTDPVLESDETGDHYEDYRSKLTTKFNSDEVGPFRLLRLDVADGPTSELMHILDTFYDPLEVNFVEIKRPISQKQTQRYLMCIIGELTDEKKWRKAGSFRTRMIKNVYGVSTRGRKAKVDERTRDMKLVALHGANIKGSTHDSIQQRGENPAYISDKDYRRNKQRMIRATKTFNKLTSR